MNWRALERDRQHVLSKFREGVYESLENVARVIERYGHDVAFLSLADHTEPDWPDFPARVLTLAEAARHDLSPGRPDSVSYLPFDLVRSMGRLLDRLQPRAILIVETEIWPNLIRVAGRRGIPIILVNGRISPRAFPRYRAVAWFLRHVLIDVRLFAMQTKEDAASDCRS